MTKITEEMQMKIFDLLEGNLSDREKAEVVNLISSSAELQKEYNLLSKTYLIPEEEQIVFPYKNKLYRKPGLFISWNPIIRYAAASVIIAACAYSGWYFMRSNTGIQSNGISKEHHAIKKSESAPSQVNSGRESDVISNPNHANYVSKKQGKIQKINAEKPQKEIGNPKLFKQQLPIYKSDEPLEDNAEVIADVIQDDPNMDSSKTAVIPQGPPVRVSKKRSLSYKLLHNSREMLANLQLPNVKFKAEKNNNRNIPTIKMEIRTYKTDVIATLIE